MNTSKERDQGLRSRVRMYAPLMMAAAVILLSAAQGAAGASGGWYLMKAPQKSTLRDWLPAEVQSWLIYHYHIYPSNGFEDYDWDAPLSQWTQKGVYESLAECQNEKAAWNTYISKRLREFEHEKEPLRSELQTSIDLGFYDLSCVATDDPRLAR